MVERSGIDSITAIRASDNNHVSGQSKAVFAVDLLLSTVHGR
jgi:hypothetical protein